MIVHELSRRDARRIAVRAQLLDRRRPESLLDAVRHLTLLQQDLTAAVAPSADLVVWSRLGSSYDRAELATAIEDRTLIDLRGMIRPREDLALYRAEMAGWSTRTGLQGWHKSLRDWVQANDACRRDILDRLAADGPLPLSALPDTCQVRWESSGWNDDRNVTMLLDLMVVRGEVAVAGREVEGVNGVWRIDPAQLGQPFAGRAALLSPLDRLVYDRKRTRELFEFDYGLEMYKPAAKRRWGYYALPILYGDRLVGKLDATADRKGGVLRVDTIHEDVPFNQAMSAAVTREIKDLARWLGLALDVPA